MEMELAFIGTNEKRKGERERAKRISQIAISNIEKSGQNQVTPNMFWMALN